MDFIGLVDEVDEELRKTGVHLGKRTVRKVLAIAFDRIVESTAVGEAVRIRKFADFISKPRVITIPQSGRKIPTMAVSFIRSKHWKKQCRLPEQEG